MLLIHRSLHQRLVDQSPGLGPDGFEDTIQERVIHDGLFPRTHEVLQELAIADPHDGLAVRAPFHHHHNQRA